MTTTTTETATPVAKPHAADRAHFVRGFSCGLRALVAKDLRGWSRGWRSVAMLTGYLLALAGGVAGYLALAGQSTIGTSPWLGLQLLSVLAFAAVLLLAFIPVSLMSSAISGERERRTLDLMLVTRASAVGLAAGKLAGSLLYVLFLLIASLPAFALVYLFGGVPIPRLVLILVVAGATAVVHASLGLVLSALLRRTIVASIVAYIIVLVLLFGLPFAAVLARGDEVQTEDVRMVAARGGLMRFSNAPTFAGQGGGPPPRFAYASPLVALASVLPSGVGAANLSWAGGFMGGTFAFGASLIDALIEFFSGGAQPAGPAGENLARTVYIVPDAATGALEAREMWAPWVYYVAGSVFAAPFAVLLTGALIAPRSLRSSQRVTSRRVASRGGVGDS